MLKRNFWNVEVEINESATAEWYLTSEPWGCDCDDCKNFLEFANAMSFQKQFMLF